MDEGPRKRLKSTYPLVIEDEECSSGKRTVRSRIEHLAVERGKRVECANTLPLQDFETTYLPDQLTSEFASWEVECGTDTLVGVFTSHAAEEAKRLRLDPDKNPDSVLLSCRDLIEKTSKSDYMESEVGWSLARKWEEMTLPDMKYYVLQDRTSFQVIGFVSFMVTYEDGREVLYVYEVHVDPEHQGKGLGRRLMEIAEWVGRNVGLEKVMLTVFRCNARAIGMYDMLGYAVDEYSPQPKTLRNGTLKESSYVILSKTLKEPTEENCKRWSQSMT